ncbi:low temperature requirement protein A [Actinacidiphila sp. DG2A-62]|uniref:low temperature requirement protein A n=1 Tax=Actinacidiphila sp. DG2A-62 TaxID=3108821 RepID=UPI003FA369B1
MEGERPSQHVLGDFVSDAPSEENAPRPTDEERHATWLELFFDLIVVVGTAQLAHVLHGEPSLRDVGQYILLFLAFWTIWMCLRSTATPPATGRAAGPC